jgi:hypothetical protein
MSATSKNWSRNGKFWSWDAMPLPVVSRASQRTRIGSPKFIVLCWILLRCMPLKYAAAGLVALEWQGQRRLLGILVEHWDVIQDETTPEQSKSGRPMFGHEFPRRCISRQWEFLGFCSN